MWWVCFFKWSVAERKKTKHLISDSPWPKAFYLGCLNSCPGTVWIKCKLLVFRRSEELGSGFLQWRCSHWAGTALHARGKLRSTGNKLLCVSVMLVKLFISCSCFRWVQVRSPSISISSTLPPGCASPYWARSHAAPGTPGHLRWGQSSAYQSQDS